jgi:hypothetical protein
MWSVLRTILAVLNLLGAIAFCALAGMDYGKRQIWSHAVLVHDLAINGLPLDKDETDADNQKIVDLLTDDWRKEALAVHRDLKETQVEEVERVKNKLSDAIKANNADTRVQLLNLSRILMPLAISEGQRERLVAIQNYMVDQKTLDGLKSDLLRAALAAKDPKRLPAKPFADAFAEELQTIGGRSRKPFAEAYLVEEKKSPGKKPDELFADSLEQMRQNLQGTFDTAFAPALTGQLTTQGSTREERKAVIASLLFNLVEPLSEIESQQLFPPKTPLDLSQGPYKRYLLVVGLEAGVKAIRQRAEVLTHMSQELQLEMVRDRSTFVIEHQKLVNLLQQLAVKESRLSEVLSRQKDLLAKRQELVNSRKQNIVQFEGDLAKLNKEVAERLSEVRSMNDELYKVRVATRNANEANQQYERQIRSLEEGK